MTTSLLAKVTDHRLWDDGHRPAALTAGERDAAQQALMAYAEMPRGTRPERISKLFASMTWMPSRDGGEAQAKMQLAVYKATLGDIDDDVLAAAVREAIRTLKFFPSVAELREIAGRLPMPRRALVAWRLRELLRAEPAPPTEPMADPAEVADLLDNLRARMALPLPEMPPQAQAA